MVISHSCDLARDVADEPQVDVLIGTVVDEASSTSRNGHSIGKLHLEMEVSPSKEWVEYLIGTRKTIDKSALLQLEPWPYRYPFEQRRVLQRWLAQRYARSEFPDAFIDWLRKSGVDNRFERVGKSFSASLVGIYFDLEDDTERADITDPYALGIQLVYDASNAENVPQAESAALRLTNVFRDRCLIADRWQWIELLYCDAVSDMVFSLQAARRFRRWRFEHRSINGEPFDPDE